jgi:outer membrane protein N
VPPSFFPGVPMKTLASVAVVIVLGPAVALAQQPPAQPDALIRLANEQLRRIEALEVRVSALQEEVKALRAQPGTPPAPVPVAIDDNVLVDHALGGEQPDDPQMEGPASDLPSAIDLDAYGSLRALVALDSEGQREVRNNGSRVGVRGEKMLIEGVQAFARAELGINMVANDRAILSGGDPGAPIGQGSQAVSSRLGFVGVDTDFGSFAWGKQWSAYYDVAEFADQFQIWSGSANGAFAAGTDGGIAGTGRAERAIQYREARGPFSVAVQMQSRTGSPNDRAWADAWGASTVIGQADGLSVGAAYNEVRDGIESPGPNDSQLGDKAGIFGVRYRHTRWYAAVTYSLTEKHEIDDLGRRFDGRGLELALRVPLHDRFWVEGGYNDLQTRRDHPGDFRIRFGVANAVYVFGPASRVFAGLKFEGSRNSDGSSRGNSAFGAGLNFTF